MKKSFLLFASMNVIFLLANVWIIACGDSNATPTVTLSTQVVEEAAVLSGGTFLDNTSTAVCPTGTTVVSGACKISGLTDNSDGSNLESGVILSQELDVAANSFKCVWSDDLGTNTFLTLKTQAVCVTVTSE